jgi:hypothetical protein
VQFVADDGVQTEVEFGGEETGLRWARRSWGPRSDWEHPKSFPGGVGGATEMVKSAIGMAPYVPQYLEQEIEKLYRQQSF